MTRFGLAWLLLLLALPAQAQEVARIEGQAGQLASGRMALNQAAGAGNAQANQMALAWSESGIGQADAQSMQAVTPGDRTRSAQAGIDGGAFQGVQGVLSINQVAGSGNAQANLFVVDQGAMPAWVVDDTALAQAVGAPPAEGAGTPPTAAREARIDAGAFSGSTGVIQVNQGAGVGNAATNAIVLHLPLQGGTP